MMGEKRYWSTVAWGPRREIPEQLAARLIAAIEHIRNIDPIFSQWYTVPHEQVFVPLDLRTTPVAERIASALVKDDDDTPLPVYGYAFSAYNFDQPRWRPSGFRMSINVGSTLNRQYNSVSFATSLGCDPDPTLVSFDLFKCALLVLAEAFDASFGYTSSDGLAEIHRHERETPRLDVEWMTYLGSRFALFANPPPSAIVERRPNGGLFMAATDEVFSTDEPEHLTVAQDVQAAVAPFNALKKPYPGLELPEP